ncbi:MAG: hypothetical protein AAFQ87_20655 [Bacteroidota bacterium]
MKSLLSLCCLFFVLNLLSAQTYTGSEADIEQILQNVSQFSEHVMAGDAKAIANAYTEDGKI